MCCSSLTPSFVHLEALSEHCEVVGAGPVVTKGTHPQGLTVSCGEKVVGAGAGPAVTKGSGGRRVRR